jgi:hypothetical protein
MPTPTPTTDTERLDALEPSAAAIEAACVSAYNEFDMGRFPQDAVDPDFERDYMRVALRTAYAIDQSLLAKEGV